MAGGLSFLIDSISAVEIKSAPAVPVIATGAAIGDSTVAAYAGGTAIASLLFSANEVSAGYSCVNLAVPGDTIDAQKTAWNNYADQSAVDWVMIQVGLNDVSPTEPIATTMARYQALVDQVRADIGASKKIYLATMTPAYLRWGTLFGVNQDAAQAHWEAMNEAISGVGANAITGVDGVVTSHTAAMGDASDNLLAEYDTGDGIHTNTAGRQVNADAWRVLLVSEGFAS